MKSFLRAVGITIIGTFALIGFAFTGVFVAMKLGVTKTAGLVDTQNDFWNSFKNRSSTVTSYPTVGGVQVPLGSWVKSDEWQVLKLAIIK